jgi:hypothetical protein
MGKAVHFFKKSDGGSAFKELIIQGDLTYEDANGQTRDVTDIANANPQAFSPGGTLLESKKNISYAIELTKILYGVGNPRQESQAFAIISGIQSQGSAGYQKTYGSKGRFAYVNNNSNSDDDTLKNAISGIDDEAGTFTNTSQGIVFCLKDLSSTDRVAAISYGIVPQFSPDRAISNGQTTVSQTYFDDSARALGC